MEWATLIDETDLALKNIPELEPSSGLLERGT